MFGDLNEHQHLEAYLGFIVRLAHALKNNRVDEGEIVAALRTSDFWHAELAANLVESARKQIESYNAGHDRKAEEPIWMTAMTHVNRIMMFPNVSLEATGSQVGETSFQ